MAPIPPGTEKNLQLRYITQYYGSMQHELLGHIGVEALKRMQDALNFIMHKTRYTDQSSSSIELKERVNTAIIVIKEVKLNINTAIAALIYTTVIDGFCTFEDIDEYFQSETAEIVKALCTQNNATINAESIGAYKEGVDIHQSSSKAALVGLARNLYVMQKLANNNATEKMFEVPVSESNLFYIPLAHRLRLYYIKGELEDICFRFEHPLEYYATASKLQESQLNRKAAVKKFSSMVETTLKEHGITCKIKARAKSIYSIWNKQTKLRVPFNDIHDLLAVRIIINNIKDVQDEYISCWEAYHLLTNLYAPKVAKMRDWISIPKENGYEALHTTIINKDKRIVEIQIRTQRMDDIAERGGAAHWKYKASYLNPLTEGNYFHYYP